MATVGSTHLLSPQFTKLVDNILGAEGPVFDKTSQFFMVAPGVEKEGKPAGQILKVSFNPLKVEILCEPCLNGDGGIPAGCQADKDGNLYVADMRLGILFVKPNGEYKQVATCDESGRTLQGCNDCALDYDGNLWVTAPAGEIAPNPYTRSSEEPFGSIYCLTSDNRLVHLDSGFLFPNGIAVMHDKDQKPTKLIVAETFTRTLWAYDILAPGKIANKVQWGKLPDKPSGPDGMDFDERGNLLVAHHGGGHIEVFGPSGGDPISSIVCPFKQPSNVHFQPGTSTVMVTEHTNNGLWSFQWDCKGMPQYCDL